MKPALYVKRHWKLILNVVTITALVLLAYAIRHQLVLTLENLGHVKAWALLLLIPVEALNYHSQAKLYQRLFEATGEKVRYRDLLRISVELNFVNHVFPSGGVSGISYFGLMLRQFGVRVTRATLIQTFKLVLLFLSFEVLLFFGMVILAVNGHADGIIILLGSVLATLAIGGTAIFLFVIRSNARINAFLMPLVITLNRLIHIVRRKYPETIKPAQAQGVFREFHEDYMLLESNHTALRSSFTWALAANITEVLAVYVVYIAFSAYVNIGAVILAYAVANFAGLVSVLPGGVGIYEALMTATLVASGIPARLSLPVTIMYRVCNTLLQVPPGYVLYHRTLHRQDLQAEAAGNNG